jgi:hypothetical protein
LVDVARDSILTHIDSTGTPEIEGNPHLKNIQAHLKII